MTVPRGRLRARVLAVALVFSAAGAARASERPAASTVPVAGRHLLSEYTSRANITYTVAGASELKLDVYRARTPGAPRPTLVFVHGGGWVAGAKEDAVLWLVPWLEAGWSAVNVEYRLARVAHAPAAVEDVRCALRWVFRNAEEHGFDPARIVVSGDSAGGHLALAMAMLPDSLGLDRGCTVPYPAGTNSWASLPEWKIAPAAVVNWYGITDVEEMLAGEGGRGYAVEWLGAQRDREALARSLSPLSHARAGVPPVITVHGDADTVVPYRHATRLHEALGKAGVAHQLVTVKGGAHGRFTPAEMDRAYAAIAAFLQDRIGVAGP